MATACSDHPSMQSKAGEVIRSGDQNGGMERRIAGVSSAQIIVDDPAVSCVELIGNPRLEQADLRTCKAPLHLGIRDCPTLTTILLPQSPEGAVIHWELAAVSQNAFIHGTVAHIDVHTPNGERSSLTAKQTPFLNARLHLKPGADRAQSDVSETSPFQALIAFESDFGWIAPFLDTASVLRGAMLSDAALPEATTVSCTQLQTLVIRRAAHLRVLTLTYPLHNLTLQACPHLSTVHGDGHRLRITDAAAPTLSLHGGWQAGIFRNLPSRLTAGLVSEVVADGCSHICPDRLLVNDSSDPCDFLPSPDCLFDQHWRGLMVNWCRMTASPAQILAALRMLDLLIETGFDPCVAWAVRNEMRQGVQRNSVPDHFWVWSAPRDMRRDVYRADLKLWMRGAHHKEAEQEILWFPSRVDGFCQLAVLAHHAVTVEADRPIALRLLDQAMNGLDTRIQPPRLRQRNAEQISNLATVMRSLIALRHDPLIPSIVDGLTDVIDQTLEVAQRVEALSVLAQLGHERVRSRLLAVGRHLTEVGAHHLATKARFAALQSLDVDFSSPPSSRHRRIDDNQP